VAASVASASNCSVEDLLRNRMRRGESKQRSDAGDILNLWEFMDTLKMELPVFVAANQKRIPPMSLTDTDMCVLSVNMMEMKEQLKIMASEQKRLVDTVSAVHIKMAMEQVCTADVPAVNTTAPLPVSPVECTSQPYIDTWTTVAKKAAASNAVMELLRPSPRVSKPVIVRGKKELSSSGTGLKSVPRRITAFVGRLHIDTSEAELKSHLEEAGVVNSRCKKLAAKDGRTFNSAASMVTCDYSCHETFYNESIWPEGCELRDWVFYGDNNTRN